MIPDAKEVLTVGRYISLKPQTWQARRIARGNIPDGAPLPADDGSPLGSTTGRAPGYGHPRQATPAISELRHQKHHAK
jgi:hypothetical protein